MSSPEELALIEYPEIIPMGCLSVNVDFNELLADHGAEAYEIVAKLKDLLT